MIRTYQKRWQEYTELYKKGLNDLNNHDGVVTHIEPYILECQVKWALGSITENKSSGVDGIPAELFQILKDAVKVLHSICQEIWKTQQKDSTEECTNYHIIMLIQHASQVSLKILQARLQQYMNQERPGVQARFRKYRGTRDQIANICWIIEKAKEFHKNICFIDCAKAFDCVDHKNWKILKETEMPDHLTCLLRNLYISQEATVRTGRETTDWFIIGVGI